MGYLKILDHRGQAIPRQALSQAPYEGATVGRRLYTWGTSQHGPNQALFGSLTSLRSRSRELIRNEPYATGGLDTWVANLIGTGITPRWVLDDSDLKNRIIELWKDWVPEADWDGLCDFYGIQSLLARCMIEAGEVLVRFRYPGPEQDLAVPFQLQVLEPDHLDHNYNTVAANGNEIRMGIEFNSQGQIAAYWLFKEHPGESFALSGDTSRRVRIPASEILHIFRPLRAGQRRGGPWLASVILAQHDLNQFDDAELVRKKGAAMFGGFITQNTGLPPSPLDGTMPFGEADENLSSDQAEVVAMEPGTFPKLPRGLDVKFSTPADVGGGYEAFTKRQDRRIARGFGLPYEKYTGNLEGVNYSSIRTGNLEFQRTCKMIIFQVLAFQFCRKVTQKWMDHAVLTRKLEIDDYVVNRRRYQRILWDLDGWPWVDPEADLAAEKEAVRCGFKSRSQVVGESGSDSEKLDEEISQDNARADRLGNIYDSDPRKIVNSKRGNPIAGENQNESQ